MSSNEQDASNRKEIERKILDGFVDKEIERLKNKKEYLEWKSTTECPWSKFFLVVTVYITIVTCLVLGGSVILDTNSDYENKITLTVILCVTGILPMLMVQIRTEF